MIEEHKLWAAEALVSLVRRTYSTNSPRRIILMWAIIIPSLAYIFMFPQIIDPFTNEKLKCLQPCSDNQYSMKTSTSGFPAKATFHYSQEACVLLLKFFEKCKTLQSWVTTHLCEETSLLFWHMIAVILTTSSSLKQQLSTLIIRAFVQQLEMKVSRTNSNSSFKGEICFLMKSENIDLSLC